MASFVSGKNAIRMNPFLACSSYWAVRNRIPFAATNLNVAAQAVKCHRSSYAFAFGLMILQIIWVLVWYYAILYMDLNMTYVFIQGHCIGWSSL